MYTSSPVLQDLEKDEMKYLNINFQGNIDALKSYFNIKPYLVKYLINNKKDLTLHCTKILKDTEALI